MVGCCRSSASGAASEIVHATIGWFVNSMGFASRIGTSYAAMLVASLPLLIVAADLGGAEGVAWVMVGNVVAMTTIVGAIAHRRIGISGRRQWDAVRSSVLATFLRGLQPPVQRRRSTVRRPAPRCSSRADAGSAPTSAASGCSIGGCSPTHASSSARCVRAAQRLVEASRATCLRKLALVREAP